MEAAGFDAGFANLFVRSATVEMRRRIAVWSLGCNSGRSKIF
jgi:hypothetical protein